MITKFAIGEGVWYLFSSKVRRCTFTRYCARGVPSYRSNGLSLSRVLKYTIYLNTVLIASRIAVRVGILRFAEREAVKKFK